jgi:transposase
MRKKTRMLTAVNLRARGYKQREIANLLSVSERTVRNYLKNPPSVRRRTPRNSLLDPYKPIIDNLLREQPFYNCMQLFRNLKELGYPGQVTIVREYVAKARVRALHEILNSHS